jgi:hypothetical protein
VTNAAFGWRLQGRKKYYAKQESESMMGLVQVLSHRPNRYDASQICAGIFDVGWNRGFSFAEVCSRHDKKANGDLCALAKYTDRGSAWSKIGGLIRDV